MATQLSPLFVRVGADIKGYMAGMGKVQTTARQTGAKIAAAAKIASFAILGIGIAAVKLGIDFEKSMANVNTLLGGNSKRIKELGEDVKRMARATGKSLDDLTGGLYQVISAFGDSADAVKILDISAKAAVAGLSTTTEAINLISAVTKGYGDTSAEAAQKAADLAFTTVRLGQTTFPELAASIGRVIPLAAKMGVSVEEVNAAFATLTGVTGDTAEVSTQLAGIMRAFIKPTTGMQKALATVGKELGNINLTAEELISERGLVGAMTTLIATTDGTTIATGKLFRRAEALTALFALTGGSADKFALSLREMGEASGASTEAFEIQADTFQNRMDRLVQEIATGLVDLGTTLLPMAENILTWAGNVARLAGEIGKLFEAAGKAADQWIPQWLKDAFSGAGQATWVKDLFSGGMYTAAGRGTAYWVEQGTKGRRAGIIDLWRQEDAAKAAAIANKKLAAATREATAATAAAGVISAAVAAKIAAYNKEIEALLVEVKKFPAVLPSWGEALEDLVLPVKTIRDLLEEIAGFAAVPWAAELETLELPSQWESLLTGLKLPAATKSSLSKDMGDAFIDGFQGAMKNIQDIWQATIVGLGQAFSVALSKELGTGFWGTFLSSVGGSLISSAIGFIFGGGGKTDLGLPTFTEAQELLAEKAREAAEALASIKDEIADTNVSIFRAKLSLDGFRDSLEKARKAERDAALAIRAVGKDFAITQQRMLQMRGGGATAITVGTLTGGAGLAELQRLIEAAATGTGRKLDFISRKEQKEILELVQGEQNKILAAQLIEAAAARRLIEVNFALQKEQLSVLRDTRRAARKTREGMTDVVGAIDSSKNAIVDAIDNIRGFQSGTRFVPQTGLAIVHRGEQIIPARGERGTAGIDAGGGMPTSLTAHIYIGGERIETVITPIAVAGVENAIASRETSIRVNTRERRG